MDFWARLIGGAGSQIGKSSNNPQQRLSRFKRLYDQIRETYDKSPLLQTESPAAETIRSCFQRLTTILHDEARSPAPHLCLQYASTAQIFVTIARIGAVAQNEAIIREAVSLFVALIDSEEEDFLGNERFARSLMLFVDRTCGSGNLFVGEDTEAEIVELLFGIAAKIRLQPEILPVWFATSARTDARRTMRRKDDFVGVTSKEDFPLCYQLIDHVHHDGRIGDFSRTGLLYIFESAAKSQVLEQWIVESDLPTLMASGLGALYGRLSRKLSILHPPSQLPIILTLSDYSDLQAPSDAESLYSDTLQQDLETFLSYLLFWQDILEHCRSLDVTQTLLDHFQVLFLQQLLYPSILESSDVDGGSSVAVLTYLRQILDSLEANDIVDLLLQYLFGISEDATQAQTPKPRSPLASKRRMSLLMMTQTADEDDRMNPSVFSLVDLLLDSTTSSNPQTVIAAFRLLTVALSKEHKYCLNTLLKVTPAPDGPPHRTHGALNAEIEAYLALAEAVAGEAGMNEAYESHLKDALRLIESHVCSGKFLSLQSLGITSASSACEHNARSSIAEVSPHYLRLEGSLFQNLLSVLESFLTNNVELNLSLTESIIALTSCPHVRLEGWAAVEPRYYDFSHLPPNTIEERDRNTLQKLQQVRREPKWSGDHSPLILRQLGKLQDEVRQLTTMIPSFARLVNSRKQAFLLHDDISEAMQRIATHPPPSSSPLGPDSTPQKSQSLSQRILTGVGTPIRSPSRGRTSTPDLRPKAASSPQAGPGAGQASPSPSRRVRPLSGEAVQQPTQRAQNLLADVIEAANSEALATRITFPLKPTTTSGNSTPQADPRGNAVEDESQVADDDEADASSVPAREASLNHILTNVVILQDFVLEFVAVMQVRASMFGEVVFAEP